MFPYESKVLNFFPPKKISRVSTLSENTWPVFSRKRPMIQAPETILDMPHFDSSIGEEYNSIRF